MHVKNLLFKKAIILMVVLIIVGMARNGVVAKEVNAASENRFYAALRKTELVVVLFYKDNRDERKAGESPEGLLNIFKSLSKFDTYRYANINFVKVNVEKAKVASVAQDFKITQFPTVLLFKDGDVVTDDNGNRAVLSDLITRSTLKNFIDTNLSDDIDAIIEKKREENRIRAENRAVAAAAWYGSYGYGYPGWGWGGYGYPGWGFGGGWGWRRGWW